jgi:hypothetical protein
MKDMRCINYLAFLAFILAFSACGISSDPNEYLTEDEQLNFKNDIIRFVDHLPKKTKEEDKYNPKHDDYYQNRAEKAILLHYYPQSNGEIYFAIAKIAPSIKVKRVATIGKVRKDDSGNIIFYEEICRTWKMVDEELNEKTKMVFQDVVKGRNIEKYLTKNSLPDYIIEFPDDLVKYDTLQRKWVVR